MGENYSEIDSVLCVGCELCLPYCPRSVRKFFSDLASEYKETRIPGRGTEEIPPDPIYGEAIVTRKLYIKKFEGYRER